MTSDIAPVSGVMTASSTLKHKEQSEAYCVFIFSLNTGENQGVQSLNRQQILSPNFEKNLK